MTSLLTLPPTPCRRPLTNDLIAHAQFARAIALIEQCHNTSTGSERPINAKVFGVSGVGKTSALRSYAAKYPPTKTEAGTRVPVLYVEVPAQPSAKSLLTALLSALGAQDAAYGTTSYQMTRFMRLATACEVELLLIDEIQHFVDRGRARTHSAAADMLKMLIEGFRKPCLMGGAPRASSLFLLNNQLRNRFMTTLVLRPFTIQKPGRPDYLGFLKAVSENLPDALATLVKTSGFADRLFYATDGLPRVLVDFLRHMRDAVDGGAQPNLQLASTIFRTWLWAEATEITDPFSLSFAARRLTGLGEPYEPGALDGDNHA